MKFISRLTIFFYILVIMTSCEFHCSVGESAERKDTKNAVIKDGAAIFNNIQVRTKGVSLKQAYLADKETNEKIGDDNVADMKNGVKLILLVDKGWTETEGKVFLGASLKATADNGETVLDEPDLFKSYDVSGIDPKDARTLSLSMFFKEWNVKRPVTIDVIFKVWDKKGEGLIEGSYRVQTK